MLFTPSKYQSAFFDLLSNGKESIFVEAVAGSGKTTTIVNGVELVPTMSRTIFLAYNKAIAVELEKRIGTLARVCTFHAFGLEVIRNHLTMAMGRGPRLVIADKKTIHLLEQEFNLNDPQQKKRFLKLIPSVMKVVSLLKSTLLPASEWGTIAEEYGIYIPSEVPESEFGRIVGRVLSRGLEMDYKLDFDDMIYWPIMKGMHVMPYDNIFVDEVQDVNLAQIKLIEMIAAGGGRVIGVGDPAQAIYGFRGADKSAVDNFVNRFKCERLPLSVCYRCPKLVIQAAQQFVPQIEWSETAEDGIVRVTTEEDFVPGPGDFVLCRVNAPLFTTAFDLMDKGIPFHLTSLDILPQLTAIVNDCCLDSESTTMLRAKLVEKMTHKKVSNALAEVVDVIISLAPRFTTVGELLGFFSQVLRAKNDPGAVILSTVHRSKGLEANRVWIIQPQLMPHPNAKSDSESIQENNLIYVAMTRARKELISVGPAPWRATEHHQVTDSESKGAI
jgi:DNA helicase-2/ATP-dependent DNA helicase PcrA